MAWLPQCHPAGGHAMNDVTIIDQPSTPSPPISTRVSGCWVGEVAFLTATLIVIDMTIAGLLGYEPRHRPRRDVIAKLLRKVLYVGAFAYIINNFNWLGEHRLPLVRGLGIATGSAITMENFLQPGGWRKPALTRAGRSSSSSTT